MCKHAGMLRRTLFTFALVAVVLFAFALPAWAHVTVSPASAPKGSDAVLTFVVPNEIDGAHTNKVVIVFPTDHPIADALVEPVAGWKAEVATMKVTTPIQTDSGSVTEAVKSVTWTATAGGIAPGDFQRFAISVGLPDATGELAFPTQQSYDNGQTVPWVDVTPPGGPEPDHPRPTVTLTAGDETAATTASALPAHVASTSDTDSAKTTGVIALVVGIVALLVALSGWVLGRRRAEPRT